VAIPVIVMAYVLMMIAVVLSWVSVIGCSSPQIKTLGGRGESDSPHRRKIWSPPERMTCSGTGGSTGLGDWAH
jgi:hypothetical protein